MHRNKAQQLLRIYQQRGIGASGDEERAFQLALCHVKLGDYGAAQQLFERSIRSMLSLRTFWAKTARPDRLVDVYVLSGRTDLREEVDRLLAQYRQGKVLRPGAAAYAYSIMQLIGREGNDLGECIEILLQYPKARYQYAWGICIEALRTGGELGVHKGLKSLLKEHTRHATGELRDTAEGLACMPAMSLTHTAWQLGMEVEIQNNYLPLGYLRYLRKQGPLAD